MSPFCCLNPQEISWKNQKTLLVGRIHLEMPGDGVDLALHLHLHTTSVVRLDLGILGTMLNLHQGFEIMIRRSVASSSFQVL